jgi:hypothetical protein
MAKRIKEKNPAAVAVGSLGEKAGGRGRKKAAAKEGTRSE